MPRHPIITKELILQASLDLLIKEGYSAVTIKNIAKSLHCSTQPISWHFGCMNGLREALLDYALQYVKEKYPTPLTNPFFSFYLTGKAHIDMALKTPNLFRFLYMGESGMQLNKNISLTIKYPSTTYSIPQIAEFLGIGANEAIDLTQTMLFYTHGLSSMIVGHTIDEPDDLIFQMFDRASVNLLTSYGIPHQTCLTLIKDAVNDTSNTPT